LGLDFLLCLFNFLLLEKEKKKRKKKIFFRGFLYTVTKDGEEKIKKTKTCK